MNIEEEVFKRAHVNIKKLTSYGFKKIGNKYCYSKTFLDNNFRADITIDNKGKVKGKVIDLQFDCEYTNIRLNNITGEFVSKVKEKYQEILIDIKNNCYDINYFISDQANRITNYIIKKYQDKPEFLWNKFKGYGVFRNKNNNKWYGIIMNIDKSKIDTCSGEIEILNIKLSEEEVKSLLKKKGFYKAYHMNSNTWLTIILDDTLNDDEIINLLDKSYDNVATPEEWIVPANPKYFDIMNCFNDNDELIWKQSSDIHIGDIIYIYVAEPYSKIVYKCMAIEVDIPYEYKDKNVSMNKVMKLKLIKQYKDDKYNFNYLNNLGIKAIRGPRKLTKEISDKIK